MVRSNCVSYQKKQESVSQITYKYLTADELTPIESYFLQNMKLIEIAKHIKRVVQTIYTVIN